MQYKEEFELDFENCKFSFWGRQKPERLARSPWVLRWSSSHLPHSSPQLFLGVVTSFCCFKSRWSWIVSAQVPPGPSSSSAWKLSEKDKGTRSLSAPTIHRLCSWPPASLVSKHSTEETRKGILLNVLIFVVPTLKCNHILPTAVWAGIYWALLTSQTLRHCVSTFKDFSHC